jgi:hypothetical protein
MQERSSSTDSVPRAQNGTLRRFTPATEDALQTAATRYSSDPFEGDEPLREAIIAAVSEARSQSWRGDELLAALRTATTMENLPARQREALDITVRRRALIGFFGANDVGL